MTADEMPLLIVNADDYAITDGISLGILRAHEVGIVTSTSALAVGPSFVAMSGALRDSGLGVGAHLAVVGEDPPVLGAGEVPTLTTADGRFRRSWREFATAVMARRVDLDDLRREWGAQLDRLASAGLSVDHLDTHQHVHLLPPVTRVLIELAEARGIRAVRVPDAASGGPRGRGVRWLGRRLRRSVIAHGLQAPDTWYGLEESGHMTAPRLLATIGHLRSASGASAEIAVHPGLPDDPSRARLRWGFEWAAELAALSDPAIRAAVDATGYRLGTFADLGGADAH